MKMLTVAIHNWELNRSQDIFSINIRDDSGRKQFHSIAVY
jgi:hypothetical protein